MNRNSSKLRTYVRPEVRTVQLSSQSVLASSGNPSITNPSMPWETNGNPSISNPTLPWESKKKIAPWKVSAPWETGE